MPFDIILAASRRPGSRSDGTGITLERLLSPQRPACAAHRESVELPSTPPLILLKMCVFVPMDHAEFYEERLRHIQLS
jgi:hypothetical protein